MTRLQNRGWRAPVAAGALVALGLVVFHCAHIATVTRQCPLQATYTKWPDVRRGPLLLAAHAPSKFREPTDRLPTIVHEPTFAACEPGVDGGLQLLIGVLSSPGNFARRQAQRETWMAGAPVASRLNCQASTQPRGAPAWTAVFVVGLSGDATLDAQVLAEAQHLEDVLLLNHPEAYEHITFKTMAFLDFADRLQRAANVMKTDDDTFVNVELLLAEVRLHASPTLYWGKLWDRGLVLRAPDHKNRVSTLLWPDCLGRTYPPFMSGAGYVLGFALLRRIMALQHRCIDTRARDDARLFPAGCFFDVSSEDVHVSVLVHRAEAASGEPTTMVACNEERCFPFFQCRENAIFIHYTSPENMRHLYNHDLEGCKAAQEQEEGAKSKRT